MIKHDNIYSDLITIIIPTYNSGLYLKESLESLKLQKKKARILIADGNSDDNSLEIINKFEKDLDIKIISKSDNGQSDALNKMINLVNTPYFLWFNSDDYLCPDAVYEFENFLYNSRLEYPMVSADHYEFNKNGIIKHIYGSHQYTFHLSRGIWRGDFPSLIWNTQIVKTVGSLDESIHFNMDQDLVHRISNNSDNNLVCFHIPKTLSGFRIHNLSKTTGDLFLDKIKTEKLNYEKRYALNMCDFVIGKLIYYFLSPRIFFKKLKI